MGNVACLSKTVNLEGLCCHRGLPAFIAPNTENVTFYFDFNAGEELKLAGGGAGLLAPDGFRMESLHTERRPAKWYTVKECSSSPARQRLCISGRAFIRCPEKTVSNTPQRGYCAMKLCTRGLPVYQSIKTKTFTHTAQVTTSGVIFALFVSAAGGSFFLCPRILLVTANGDEVVLVDDRLGPLQAPLSFHVDFAILDDGRNLQMDLIFRGSPSDPADPEVKNMAPRTLRTCLQEYTAYNNQVQPASVCISSCELESFMPSFVVYLQNLVISEDKFDEPVPEPEPFDICRHLVRMPAKERSAALLFEGVDAKQPSTPSEAAESTLDKPSTPESRNRQRVADDFWYHIRYDDDRREKRRGEAGYSDYGSQIKGEFWLSKHMVDKKNVYFQCSSTLAQAATMCTVFRFSCPTDYLSLIETQASAVLRDTHIPTNGVVFGVEPDPRNSNLYRIFIEHRNQILDDMVVCEVRPEDLMHVEAHQEIYDAGSLILYRLTLVHRDGLRQAAVLQAATEQLEDPKMCDSARSHYQLVEEPSPRFPISPCLVRHNLSPVPRVFIYSTMAYEPEEQPLLGPEAGDSGQDCQSPPLEDSFATPAMHSARGIDSSMMSDATVEDWQSVGGGYSDAENEIGPGGEALKAKGCTGGSGDEPKKAAVRWRRPLIDRLVLARHMEDQPFACFPMNLS